LRHADLLVIRGYRFHPQLAPLRPIHWLGRHNLTVRPRCSNRIHGAPPFSCILFDPTPSLDFSCNGLVGCRDTASFTELNVALALVPSLVLTTRSTITNSKKRMSI